MHNKSSHYFFIALFAVALVIGCSSGRERPKDLPRLYPAKLTITQEGAPLEDATVTLHSTDPNFRWSVGGSTDAQGVVVLNTNGFYEGVPLGTYKIAISRVVRTGPPIPHVSELPDDEIARARVFAEIDRQTRLTQVVDPLYRDANKTLLEWEVVGGKNEATFDVGKPVDIRVPTN